MFRYKERTFCLFVIHSFCSKRECNFTKGGTWTEFYISLTYNMIDSQISCKIVQVIYFVKKLVKIRPNDGSIPRYFCDHRKNIVFRI